MRIFNLLTVGLCAAALSFTACDNAPKAATDTAPPAPAATTPMADASAVKMDTMAKPMYVAGKYYCAMDKDVVSDKPGKCPKCNMDLVEGSKIEAMKMDHMDAKMDKMDGKMDKMHAKMDKMDSKMEKH